MPKTFHRLASSAMLALTLVLVGVSPSYAAPTEPEQPLGGIIDPLQPPSAEAAIAASSQAGWRPEFLASVLPGQSLGINGRYSRSSDPIASDMNWATPRCTETLTEGKHIRLVTACTANKLTSILVDPTARKIVSTKTISTDGSLPIVGGVEIATDGSIYLLTGQTNEAENDAAIVVKVQKFSPKLAALGSATLNSGKAISMFKGIIGPFDAGSPDMTVIGDTLYVHMSRIMYSGHQSNISLSVKTDMSAELEVANLDYASHSFNQFITSHDGAPVIVDHGDAYPRFIRVSKRGPLSSTQGYKSWMVFSLQGDTGENRTDATLSAYAQSGSTLALAGIASPHEKTISGVSGRTTNKVHQSKSNVYISLVDLDSDDGSQDGQNFVWVSSNHPTNSTTLVGEPTIAALPSGDFAVLFNERSNGAESESRLEYRLVSKAGKVLASQSFASNVFAPVANPVLVGSHLYWVGTPSTTSSTQNTLFGLNVASPRQATLVKAPYREFKQSVKPKLSLESSGASYSTVQVNPGSWTPQPTSFTYQWQVNGVTKQNHPAASSTLLLWADEIGTSASITVTVTAHRDGYAPMTLTSAPFKLTEFVSGIAPDPNVPCEAQSPFVDKYTSKFPTEITWMYCKGYSTGIVPNKQVPSARFYEPKKTLTREAMAAFIYRLEDPKGFKVPTISPFSDLHPGDKFYREITWMHAMGLTTGVKNPAGGKPLYRPKAGLTREAMAAFIYRLERPQNYQAAQTSPFADLRSSDKFYREITWMRSSGMSTGIKNPAGGNPIYAPKQNLTREAMAAFLYRLETQHRTL